MLITNHCQDCSPEMLITNQCEHSSFHAVTAPHSTFLISLAFTSYHIVSFLVLWNEIFCTSCMRQADILPIFLLLLYVPQIHLLMFVAFFVELFCPLFASMWSTHILISVVCLMFISSRLPAFNSLLACLWFLQVVCLYFWARFENLFVANLSQSFGFSNSQRLPLTRATSDSTQQHFRLNPHMIWFSCSLVDRCTYLIDLSCFLVQCTVMCLHLEMDAFHNKLYCSRVVGIVVQI